MCEYESISGKMLCNDQPMFSRLRSFKGEGHEAEQSQVDLNYKVFFLKIFIKDTCYGLGKNSQNQQLLDILACNSANRPSFKGRTKAMSACNLGISLNKRTWITGQNVKKLQIFAILA